MLFYEFTDTVTVYLRDHYIQDQKIKLLFAEKLYCRNPVFCFRDKIAFVNKVACKKLPYLRFILNDQNPFHIEIIEYIYEFNVQRPFFPEKLFTQSRSLLCSYRSLSLCQRPALTPHRSYAPDCRRCACRDKDRCRWRACLHVR